MTARAVCTSTHAHGSIREPPFKLRRSESRCAVEGCFFETRTWMPTIFVDGDLRRLWCTQCSAQNNYRCYCSPVYKTGRLDRKLGHNARVNQVPKVAPSHFPGHNALALV